MKKIKEILSGNFKEKNGGFELDFKIDGSTCKANIKETDNGMKFSVKGDTKCRRMVNKMVNSNLIKG